MVCWGAEGGGRIGGGEEGEYHEQGRGKEWKGKECHSLHYIFFYEGANWSH